METSNFAEWLELYFPGITLRVVETFNGESLAPQYLYRRFLRQRFSVDGKWNSLSVNNRLVAADVIAMDSAIPLKNRPAIATATGDIPKMGIELAIREQKLTELQTLVAMGKLAEAQALFFSDTRMVIGGQYERLEAMFLEGLSSGVVVVEDTETVGTGVRIDYGYLAANQFESETAWSNPASKPLSDIQALLDAANLNGNTPTLAMMDLTTFNNMIKTAEVKDVYAAAFGIFGTTIPTPTRDQLNTALNDRYGFTIEVVNRSVTLQRNGANTVVKPWKTGSVVFTNTNDLGSLVYAQLAEENAPVAGVAYQKVDNFMLVSKYRLNRPSLMEVTNSQSRVVPVIDNVNAIYTLDTTVTEG